MNKTSYDVLAEWVKRGYVTQADSVEYADKYISFIEQAKDGILAYCNIPQKANMPDGLFYAWVEIAYSTSGGTASIEGSGAVKSISEGDTTVQFDVGTTVVKSDKTAVDYTAILNRYRRLP